MSDISIRKEGRAGRITLTRPQALNAMSYQMMLAIDAALLDWADDPDVSLVLIDAEGERAFCAGGDIQQIYEAGIRGDFTVARGFWAEEYLLNARISRFAKPYVALMHGFVMGGGVGISAHGSLRVACESTRIAMPECGIGLVPDVGGTSILGAAPGHLGEYLGLTGHRMGPGDAIEAGFADVYVPAERWPSLAAQLITTGDAGIVEQFREAPPATDLAPHRETIDAAFSAPDLPTLAARLEPTDWGHGVLETLHRQCPLSMACTLDLVRAARREPGLEKALTRELRCTWRCISEGDLLEGIRAAVIDKDRKPHWSHEFDGVKHGEVEAMLASLGENELDLSALA